MRDNLVELLHDLDRNVTHRELFFISTSNLAMMQSTADIPFYMYKRPGRASQNSSLIISQCVNSILDRTDLDLVLFFFPFGFVGLLLCVFSSGCDDGVLSSKWINSSVMSGDGRSVPG